MRSGLAQTFPTTADWGLGGRPHLPSKSSWACKAKCSGRRRPAGQARVDIERGETHLGKKSKPGIQGKTAYWIENGLCRRQEASNPGSRYKLQGWASAAEIPGLVRMAG